MFRFRWLGRILICLLVGLVFGAILMGLGPPLPKAPDHLGLDGIHKYHYQKVWELSEMPKGEDMYAFAPGDELMEEDLPVQPYKTQLKNWWWNAHTQWRSQKFRFLRWLEKKKRERESKNER